MSINFKNIFIIDWDDTLFPTNWVTTNNIDLRDQQKINKHKLYFLELDKIISEFIDTLHNYGDIYIVTNASLRWIATCMHILPKTKSKIINNMANIISARESYGSKHDSPYDWKINSFRDVLKSYIGKLSLNNKQICNNMRINIMSFGDADYEYIALIKVANFFKDNNIPLRFYLKNVKFIEKPHFDKIIHQVKMLHDNIHSIIHLRKYVDLALIHN